MRIRIVYLIFTLISYSQSFAKKNDFCSRQIVKVEKANHLNFSYSPMDWEKVGFSKTEYTHIKEEAPTYDYSVKNLSFIVLKSSLWSKYRVKNEIEQLKEVYAQCNVGINNIHLVFTNSPFMQSTLRLHSECPNEEDTQGDYKLASITPTLPGIKVFLIQKFIVGPEAYANFLSKSKDTIMENTIWISHEKKIGFDKYFDPNYQVLAHELAHVLLEEGHNSPKDLTPNIMSGKRRLLNNQFKDEQCQKILNSPHIEKLSP